jgi:hypothetical protein
MLRKATPTTHLRVPANVAARLARIKLLAHDLGSYGDAAAEQIAFRIERDVDAILHMLKRMKT